MRIFLLLLSLRFLFCSGEISRSFEKHHEFFETRAISHVVAS